MAETNNIKIRNERNKLDFRLEFTPCRDYYLTRSSQPKNEGYELIPNIAIDEGFKLTKSELRAA